MSSPAYLGDIDTLVAWLADTPQPAPLLADPTHRRLADAVKCHLGDCGRQHRHGSELDVAVLLRQIVRRLAFGDDHLYLGLEWDFLLGSLAECSVSVLPTVDGRRQLSARPWRPAELGCEQGMPDVDQSALAGHPSTRRASFLTENSARPADEFFRKATGHDVYRTAGQQASARAAVLAAPASTLISVLPTGSGKTEVAVAAMHPDALRRRTSVIVVPTVALAFDLQDRIRKTLELEWGFGSEVWDYAFAWTGTTPPKSRRGLEDCILSGEQPVVITSPESLINSNLGSALMSAAALGRLGWFIVDEAHMIDQWGRDFRPEFDQLAAFAGDLVGAAVENDREPCRTLLLSATLTAANLDDLYAEFGQNGPVHLIAANALRKELESWSAGVLLPEDRLALLRASLLHLPRPAIVYTTKPDDAEALLKHLREWGFQRAELFTGRTVGEDRREVFGGFRGVSPDTGLATSTEFDVVIGTSAFGLGVDYDQVRTVVHACVPETIERWYQEIGRAGRDGYAATSVFLPTDHDVGLAKGMGAKRLEPDTARGRWEVLTAAGFAAERRLDEVDGKVWLPVNLQTYTSGDVGSYNVRWNRQVLRGLDDLGFVETRFLLPDELGRAHLPREVDGVIATWLGVHVARPLSEDFDDLWTRWRDAQGGDEDVRRAKVKSVLSSTEPVCGALRAAFSATRSTVVSFGAAARTLAPAAPCGRCPGCRAIETLPNDAPSPQPFVEWAGDLTHLDRRRAPVALPPGVHWVRVDSTEELDAVQWLGSNGYEFLVGSVVPSVSARFSFRSAPLPDAVLCPRVPTVVVTGGGGLGEELSDMMLLTPPESAVVLVRDDAEAQSAGAGVRVRSWTEFRYAAF